ncbi:hypothetical protein FQN57_003762 [Myotisia sp. PD_48]|nr:hypothetical protein FQN57_003762 [Myotisia sp. PD_48]
MEAPKEPKAFPCTFAECMKSFTSIRELIKHKTLDPEHVYCRRCDADFTDDAALLIHKLSASTKHIACYVCGQDFKSEGGRDSHLTQLHRADQNIACHGCGQNFTRASALMSHIELGQCEGIPQDEYRKRRAEKRAMKDAIGEQLLAMNAPREAPSTTSSVDGGVNVDLLNDVDIPAVQDKKASINDKLKRLGLSTDDKDDDRKTPQNLKIWPTSGIEGDPVKLDRDLEDLMGFSEASAARKGRNTTKSQTSSTIPGPTVNRTVPPSVMEWGFLEEEDPSTVNTEKPTHSFNGGDLSRFFNSVTGTYVCPCDKSFKNLDAFEQHLASGVHSGGVVRCPGCLRMFKTTTALVAHAESASVRCRINQTTNFGVVMNDISGGILETTGYHHDRTVKFKASAFTEADKKLKEPEW